LQTVFKILKYLLLIVTSLMTCFIYCSCNLHKFNSTRRRREYVEQYRYM